ncbi:HAMP domain-containing protein [Ramlibacter sp. G-1-2-2]|uniref:HAMP domain-containing protein n=2 Tax=Ramlibacter agri TaxID=2728837 RepID=A0A848H689_9BURK|nr:HAMP domain-containing protein [Ramlibacter agri]
MEKIASLRKRLLDVTAATAKQQGAKATAAARAESAATIDATAAPYLEAQREFAKLEQDNMTQVGADFRAQRQNLTTVVCAVVLLLLAGVVAGAAFLIRSIRRPLTQAVDMAAAIARGDLTQRGDASRGDEFGDLMRALNAMSEALSRTVGQVRSAADQIATGTNQIAIGNQDLSQRTEEQASSLQQTAASMEQMGSSVRQNADAARQATELASAASAVAAEGGTAVSQVVQTMGAISEASKRIAEITSTIDGIAFQTNILALNAAVEAARAGDQGRGFAVVAGEVRNLAHRAADASREIKDLIQDSVAKVERGSVQASDAGRTMTDIVAQVKRVNDLIGEIGAATIEQTTGIGQVGHTVTQLDQVTQQNAALVEQSAAAAASLNQQAARLVEAVGAFTLGEVQARTAIATASSSAKAVAVRAPAPRPPVRTSRPAVVSAADDPDWQQF